MGGHVARQLAIKNPRPDRVERIRIQFDGSMSLLKRKQPVCMPNDVGVGDPVCSHTRDARIRIGGIARRTEQCAAGRALQGPLLRSYPSVAIRDFSVAYAECVYHAIAVERVVSTARSKLRIGADPVERSIELWRNFTL